MLLRNLITFLHWALCCTCTAWPLCQTKLWVWLVHVACSKSIFMHRFVSANKPTLSYTLSHPSFSSFPLSLTLSPLSSLSLLSLPPLSLPRRLVKRAIGLAGSPSGLFSMPIGITANSKDELFIADRQACKITKLAPDGRVVGSYGRQGRGSGGLRHPESVAVTTDRLFVVDTGNNCIQVSGHGVNLHLKQCASLANLGE